MDVEDQCVIISTSELAWNSLTDPQFSGRHSSVDILIVVEPSRW